MFRWLQNTHQFQINKSGGGDDDDDDDDDDDHDDDDHDDDDHDHDDDDDDHDNTLFFIAPTCIVSKRFWSTDSKTETE